MKSRPRAGREHNREPPANGSTARTRSKTTAKPEATTTRDEQNEIQTPVRSLAAFVNIVFYLCPRQVRELKALRTGGGPAASDGRGAGGGGSGGSGGDSAAADTGAASAAEAAGATDVHSREVELWEKVRGAIGWLLGALVPGGPVAVRVRGTRVFGFSFPCFVPYFAKSYIRMIGGAAPTSCGIVE